MGLSRACLKNFFPNAIIVSKHKPKNDDKLSMQIPTRVEWRVRYKTDTCTKETISKTIQRSIIQQSNWITHFNKISTLELLRYGSKISALNLKLWQLFLNQVSNFFSWNIVLKLWLSKVWFLEFRDLTTFECQIPMEAFLLINWPLNLQNLRCKRHYIFDYEYVTILLQQNDTQSKQHICGVDLTFTRQD